MKKSPVARLLNTVVDTILPPRCIGFTGGRLTAGDGEREILAGIRRSSVAFLPYLCGTPFSFETGEGALCASCMESPPVFDRARAAVIYNDASRKLVLNFKYGDRLHAVHTFLPWMIRCGAEMIAEADVIVPVPLHPAAPVEPQVQPVGAAGRRALKKMRQAVAARRAAPPAPHRPETAEPPRAREKRQSAPSACNEKCDIGGKNILLLNGRRFFTNGATLNECARALKKSGAEKVFVLTIARVTREEFRPREAESRAEVTIRLRAFRVRMPDHFLKRGIDRKLRVITAGVAVSVGFIEGDFFVRM